MKKILALITVIAMLFTFASCKDQGDDPQVTGAKPEDVVVKSENFSFNLAEATYIFNRYYIEFCNENAQYMSFYGIDKTKSLKEQMYTEDTTWFDYFLNQAEVYMHELLLYCEAGKAEGKELSEDDKKEIQDIIDQFYDEAEGNGYTIEELVHTLYGEAVTIDDISSFMVKEKLAFNHYNDMLESYEYTEAQEDDYLSKHPDEFYCVDYVTYTFDEDNDRDALYNAKELKETVGADDFYAYIDNYEANVLSLEEDKREGAEEHKYVLKDGDIGEWAFAAEIGDKYMEEDGAKGLYTVYMLTAKPFLQEYTTRDIRYLCLTKDTYQTNEKIKDKAASILEKWEESDKTPEAFGKLAKTYSEDESTKETGGYCPYVDKSNTIMDDEGIKWLFEEAQPGEVKLFKGDEMYYIVYYEKEGKAQWRTAADDALGEADYIKDTEEMKEKFEVESIDDILQQIDE